VLGITSVDDVLFMLLSRDENQVAVYNINDYQLLRHLTVPGLKPCEVSDMTSCIRKKCLYISDPENRCIQRFDLTIIVTALMKLFTRKHISKWSVPGSPCGLSVTRSGNLLVTCRSWISKLVELSADSGQCVRKIILQSDIQDLRHGVQMTTGQFIVCHGASDHNLHRVCLVDDEGNITLSYEGQGGSEVGELNSMSHLAVDEESQYIFVADSINDRIVLLSPMLKLLGQFIGRLSCPKRLYFHHPTRRMFVGRRLTGRVTVLQL